MQDVIPNNRASALLESLNNLPDEVLGRLQYFQPEIGCFNSCGFCSQEAGSSLWQLSRESLSDLIFALGETARRRNIGIGVGRAEHRQGVIFPYLDNDCFSYPSLDIYLAEVPKYMGCRVRVTTVGYSRHNDNLVKMHHRIVNDSKDAFAGIRVSYTPYTAGYAAQSGSKLSRYEYEADVAHLLMQYRPVFEHLVFGKSTACVELRFHPDVHAVSVHEFHLDGHHVIAAGPHLLVSCKPDNQLRTTEIVEVTNSRVVYSNLPTPYFHLVSDQLVSGDPLATAVALLAGDKALKKLSGEVPLYQFANVDGKYYGISPDFRSDGKYCAIHVYPATEQRRTSGYNNASRHFLNCLLRIKEQLGYARRDKFASASWNDVALVLEKLDELVEDLSSTDITSALHIQRHIIPLVESYVRVLQLAGYEPAQFFNPDFTIDTGQIVNQGRARKYFANLVTVDDEPFTPREARAYGTDASTSANRGKVWRIVPVPNLAKGLRNPNQQGGKAVLDDGTECHIAIHEVSEHTLRPVDYKTGQPLRRFFVGGLQLESKMRHQSWQQFLVPGSIKTERSE